MKIAVISDIHANTSALEAALDKIKSLKTDKIFCLGDILMAGYDPNGTAKIITELDNLEIIQGNTDKMVAYFSEELLEKAKKKSCNRCGYRISFWKGRLKSIFSVLNLLQ